MNALAIILLFLAAAVIASWLAGLVTRNVVTSCNERCRQGRSCNCTAMETQP